MRAVPKHTNPHELAPQPCWIYAFEILIGLFLEFLVLDKNFDFVLLSVLAFDTFFFTLLALGISKF